MFHYHHTGAGATGASDSGTEYLPVVQKQTIEKASYYITIQLSYNKLFSIQNYL